MNYRYFIVVILLLSNLYVVGQRSLNWHFSSPKRTKSSIPFKLVNNLIVITMRVNGSNPLNFIVDTGLKNTLITELSYGDSLTLNSAKEISLRGLGGEKTIPALRTGSNVIKFGKIVGENQTILVLMDNVFHLSEKLGMRIHGIIGYEIFRNFIVEINYSQQRLRFFSPEDYEYKKSKKYETFPLSWHQYKPYVNVAITVNENEEEIPMHMLIDTGSSDAIWIFKESLDSMKMPPRHIRCYLGRGLSGEVHGRKARVKDFGVGSFHLENPIASFPDSSELSTALNYKLRNGSIGGNILSRFKVVFDYPNSKITLRKNSTFRKPFYFNTSGIEISTPYPGMPIFLISEVREGSPADRAGIKAGDQLKRLNNKSAADYSLGEIMAVLLQKKRGRISIDVLRDGEEKRFRLKLAKIL